MTFDSDQPSAPVVIVGMDDERGVHVARTMARHGIETIGVVKRAKSVGSRTRTCNRVVVADTDNEAVIDRLVDLGKSIPRKGVLIPCYDTTVALISQHRQRLSDLYHFALPAAQTVALMQDKVSFYRFAQQHGFAVPKTVVLAAAEDLDEAAVQLHFPCILKPPDSKSPRWQAATHIKAFQVDDVEALRELYGRYRGAADRLIVQEMILGDDSAVHTVFGYYGRDSDPLVEFCSRKLRQWPPGAGVGCLAEEVHQEQVRDTARSLLKQLRFQGLCSLEMKRDDRDGRFYIIEANVGRPTGRCAHVEACGVELLLTLYQDVQGLVLPERRNQPFEGRKWINIRRDAMSAMTYWWRGELTLVDWWKSLRGQKSYALFSLRDPGPFIAELVRTLRRGWISLWSR